MALVLLSLCPLTATELGSPSISWVQGSFWRQSLFETESHFGALALPLLLLLYETGSRCLSLAILQITI